jgi:hypothetical protein
MRGVYIVALRKSGRSKKKGKKLSKREVAQIVAMDQIGHGPYEIGALMGRAPNTIYKYLQSQMFTDPKFVAMVEEYKTHELVDLTAMNIEARARIRDLIPTMTPIEAIACMDKAFSQRRLLEGKSTENVFSLRKIISEAHYAPQSGPKQESDSREYPQGDARGQASGPGSSHRVLEGRKEPQEEAETHAP